MSDQTRRRAAGLPIPVEHIPLTMLRPDLDGIPAHPCPDGFRIRTFRAGDEHAWAEIETRVAEFPTTQRALAHFAAEFGPAAAALADRCVFLETEAGDPIGTATAWFGDFAGQPRGRIHWVAVVPEFQSRGLAKSLLAAAMARLARGHTSAYLTTQTTSSRAVNLYLAFGFAPYRAQAEPADGWSLIETVLGRPPGSLSG